MRVQTTARRVQRPLQGISRQPRGIGQGAPSGISRASALLNSDRATADMVTGTGPGVERAGSARAGWLVWRM